MVGSLGIGMCRQGANPNSGERPLLKAACM